MMMLVREFPPSELLRSLVKVEFLNGMCIFGFCESI